MSIFNEAGDEAAAVSRRLFLKLGITGVAGLGSAPLLAQAEAAAQAPEPGADALPSFLTPPERFRTFVREKPPIDQFTAEQRRQARLDRATWECEVVADPAGECKLERPFAQGAGQVLNWAELMQLADKHAVRFLHALTCTNVAEPFGMGLWEGVPLRDILWLTKPSPNTRRVFYWGYHNDDPKQRFVASLAIGRVLEEPPGELPVILCYKLNGQWLAPKNGGPVRLFTPGAYANKSIKWLQKVVVTDSFKANDTYAEMRNDTESPMKTMARFLPLPKQTQAGQALPLAGLVQVGISGVSRVQFAVSSQPLAGDDPYGQKLPWQEARILPPPPHWGGGLPEGKLPPIPLQFDPATGQPRAWPLRYTLAQWTATLPALAPGDYVLRCRTLDANGIAQPLPRPFPRSGNNALHEVKLKVV